MILVDQAPPAIGSCVQEALSIACSILVSDLTIQLARRGKCQLLDSLIPHVFNATGGQAQERIEIIEWFRSAAGFTLLNEYLLLCLQSKSCVAGSFPSLDTMQHVLFALHDSMLDEEASDAAVAEPATDQRLPNMREVDAFDISQVTLLHLRTLKVEDLDNKATKSLSLVCKALCRIFEHLSESRRDAWLEFYALWRCLALRFITSPSLPLRLTGWEQIKEMVRFAISNRPPPRSIVCSGAGTAICNGEYHCTGTICLDGYVHPGTAVSYVRIVPSTASEGPDRLRRVVKLTLNRSITREQKKQWFLSEMDEEQPGTDLDVVFYRHLDFEVERPPQHGWVTCLSNGHDPPPEFTPIGSMVPRGEELQTLEHRLAQWVIDNNILDCLLGDAMLDQDVVNQSGLLPFMEDMCMRHPSVYTVQLVLSALNKRKKVITCKTEQKE
jgi:hypothetical protein